MSATSESHGNQTSISAAIVIRARSASFSGRPVSVRNCFHVRIRVIRTSVFSSLIRSPVMERDVKLELGIKLILKNARLSPERNPRGHCPGRGGLPFGVYQIFHPCAGSRVSVVRVQSRGCGTLIRWNASMGGRADNTVNASVIRRECLESRRRVLFLSSSEACLEN